MGEQDCNNQNGCSPVSSGVDPNRGSRRTRSLAQQAGVRLWLSAGVFLDVMVLYACLLGVMAVFRFHVATIAVTTLFFTAIGFGQVFLFKRNRPQIASLIVGAAFAVALYVFSVCCRIASGLPLASALSYPLFLVEGVVCGWFCGRVIAGASGLIRKIRESIGLGESKCGRS